MKSSFNLTRIVIKLIITVSFLGAVIFTIIRRFFKYSLLYGWNYHSYGYFYHEFNFYLYPNFLPCPLPPVRYICIASSEKGHLLSISNFSWQQKNRYSVKTVEIRFLMENNPEVLGNYFSNIYIQIWSRPPQIIDQKGTLTRQ